MPAVEDHAFMDDDRLELAVFPDVCDQRIEVGRRHRGKEVGGGVRRQLRDVLVGVSFALFQLASRTNRVGLAFLAGGGPHRFGGTH